MPKYTTKIDELFYSLGEFRIEFKAFLKSLEVSERGTFIEELYYNILSDGVNDKIIEEVKDAFNGVNYKFRYAKPDYELALKSEPTTAERLFNNVDEQLKYY